MAEQRSVHDFVHAYRAAFESFDAPAIGDLFAYPCQVTGDHGGRVSVTAVATREQWIPVVERILAGYRALGVAGVELVEAAVDELTPRLARARVRWRLVDRDGDPLYDFQAAYTLVESGSGWRIAAIAHDEPPPARAGGGRRG